MTPTGGKHLLQMRMAGKRPPGFIVVTEDRQIARNARSRDLYPLVFDEGCAYDWTLIHGLNVHVCTHLMREKTSAVCRAIFDAEPLTLHCTHYRDDPLHEAVIPYATR
jgi:hypothetical protein